MSATSTIPITVGGIVIQFPNTGASPIWSESVIQFAQAVATQLQTISSPFNIAPTVQVLTSNANSGITLNGNGSNLSFPHLSVRSFTFTYAIYRVTSTPTINIQWGTVSGIYNTNTSQWSVEHNFQGDAPNGIPYCTFDINSSDQLLLTTAALTPGIYDGVNSTISYSTTTELVHT